ncbi:hypothetical protein [Aliarcobacter butzleri]|uniref:hypothetical protein n=1 Tax=Aliarcobacter butzleri TaxID=28197 RepID=UPI003B21F6A6
MLNIVTDTNVWYDAIGNDYVLNKIKSKGGMLCVTPINILEIVSKIDINNFEIRKKAAQSIIDNADRYLMSNEIYLARYWGFKVNDEVYWKNGVLTLSRAPSYNDLVNGYIDHIDKVTRKQNLKLLKDWREYHYKDYNKGVINGIQSIHSGYLERQSNGNLKKHKKIKTLFNINDKDIKESFFACYERAKMVLQEHKINPPESPNKIMLTNAIPKIKNYVFAYMEYLRFLATTPAKPDKNDLGDLDLFLYLQNRNWLLATSDKRWIAIAKKVCPNNLLDLINEK